MLEHFVTEKNFQKGLQKYLKKHEYSNAEGKDLWKSIGEVAKKPIDKMMKTWINQVGFPILSVKRKGQEISLKQSRYLLEETKSSQKGIWKIPLIVDEGNVSTSHILEKKSGSLKLKNKDRNFIINSGRTGFY